MTEGNNSEKPPIKPHSQDIQRQGIHSSGKAMRGIKELRDLVKEAGGKDIPLKDALAKALKKKSL